MLFYNNNTMSCLLENKLMMKSRVKYDNNNNKYIYFFPKPHAYYGI